MRQAAPTSLRYLDQEWIELIKMAKALGIEKEDIQQFLKHKSI
ncbi:anti-repressor SinI family protein [Alkalibacillus sp. S2W]